MSLVAYAASSDEESDYEDENDVGAKVILPKAKEVTAPKLNDIPSTSTKVTTNGHISDDDDENYEQEEISLNDLKPASAGINRFTLSLPKPKHVIESTDLVTSSFAKLPMPRMVSEVIEEADDEFLHKKAVPDGKDILENTKPPLSKVVKGRVKISIPSLKDFSDVEQDKAAMSKDKLHKVDKPKGSSLFSLLPKPKSERNFAKAEGTLERKATAPPSTTVSTSSSTTMSRPAFVPDTVRNRRPAHNTEGVDGVKQIVKNTNNTKKSNQIKNTLVNVSDSDQSDDEVGANTSSGDFFSLNSDEKLPEISTNEINALVAKRAAKMAEATDKYLNEAAEKEAAVQSERLRLEEQDFELRQAQKRYHEQQLNTEAMDALVGKNAKRRRKEAQEMQVIDISGTDVLPDREEWLRTALTSATTYQPTGVLNDEEPVAGTRRKHQITYLAHKAKSNEAELQAMWAANRQTRRATQSKYGF